MEIRDKIIEGAAEMFRKYGIKAVTMDSLAAHLGVSKRTIYENFSDKDDLLKGVLTSMAARQKELVERILGESENAINAIFRLIELNVEHFFTMSPAFTEDIKRFHQEMMLRKDTKCELPDYRNNKMVIERGIKEKLFRKDINGDIVNRTIYLMVLSVMNTDLFPLESFSRREVVMNSIVNYLKGIATPEGLEIIKKHEKTILI
ncbi:MAG TPA: TetR/AcrR family transcriptional regulator [Bacteroidales bacterium]|nr:TetR/AcrR family transcriptional regulator [Bacteroidales bacterium]HRR92990.1 TetR/AcrR family transcriptional regulator [Bacteroidales bacterium]HRT88997.1 TetR/AcrR family transcriptional regulator [Bacteroidales bacterium]